MRRSDRSAALLAALLAFGGCNLEVNIHLDSGGESEAPTASAQTAPAPAPMPPEGAVRPRPPAPPTIRVIPSRPDPSRVIRDALWRSEYEEKEVLLPPPPREAEDLRAAPTFTPFTEAPAIRNVPEVRAALEALYPPELRAAGVEGTVRVYFFIEADGRATNVRLDQASRWPELNEAALAVADVYRFSPAKNRGEAVPVWVSFPISFRIR